MPRQNYLMKRVSTFIILVLLPFASLLSQHNKLVTGKPPVWVVINPVDYNSTALDKEAEDGSVDMSFEKQVNLNNQSVYIGHCIKILSAAGLQDNSNVDIYFDPTFQQLTIHSINIIRNNVVINKLNLQKIKVIHVETELDKFIYNGQLEATLILDDVRKGDIIQYSYTLTGFNPVFQNKFQYFLDTKFSVPVYNFYYKIIASSNRVLNIKNIGDTINPTVHIENENKIYEWRGTNCHPVHAQDQLPDWYNPYGFIMISEFSSWKDVNNWAMSLFPKNAVIGIALSNKIKEINTAYTTKEAKTLAALRFVQDDIRYMGIEMGLHSHKPTSPANVFNQRFGDCKEKSYLLCVMLNAMDIDACPVLINTSDKKAIIDWLPAAIDFDHCTVCVTINNKRYWLDPTISYQRGSLPAISYPDYQWGLVLTDATTTLTNIQPQGNNEEYVREIFTIPNEYGKGYLKVITTYSGSYADDERSDFSSNSNYELQEDYLNFYKDYINGITADSLTYTDNDSTGIFTTTEYYSIDSFWTVKPNTKTANLTCYVISSLLKKPKETKRTMPLGLDYPVHYKEEVDIELPGTGWDFKQTEAHVQCAAFLFNKTSKVYDHRILINYDYERLKDNVMPGETGNYISSLDKINDEQDYELTWSNDYTNNYSDSHAGNTLGIVVAIIILIGLVVRWTQKR